LLATEARSRREKNKLIVLEKLNQITDKIIGCAIEIHKQLGPGLLESLYEKALFQEFRLNKIDFKNQLIIPILYKNQIIGEHRIDFLVEDEIIIELKAAERMEPVFHAQLLSYLRLTKKKLGLLINFNVLFYTKALKESICN
jgi:GxxExxY protein